ncbi:MAG TPA: 30S ribosomal protein S16 [Desulfomonilaceae bacterium]|nr:30S ribosomal protein S16 [Desulfomonilaceae bacterium]
MAVKIRLARYGAKKKPFYRVVAANSRFARDGRFLEVLGTYDPMNKEKGINLNIEAIRTWIARGAEVSDTVNRIMNMSAPAATTPGQ